MTNDFLSACLGRFGGEGQRVGVNTEHLLLWSIELTIPDKGFRDRREDERTDERPWNSTRKCHMIVLGFQSEMDVLCRDSIFQYVVCGLYVERFFDLGKGRHVQVNLYQHYDDQASDVPGFNSSHMRQSVMCTYGSINSVVVATGRYSRRTRFAGKGGQFVKTTASSRDMCRAFQAENEDSIG